VRASNEFDDVPTIAFQCGRVSEPYCIVVWKRASCTVPGAAPGCGAF
jgi:hypothetical protein